jgi:SHS2 domain-containing protein
MSGRWEHFAHGADIGVRGIGSTEGQAFEQAALAMTAVIVEPSTVAARQMRNVECEAPDDELLFVEWLNALIYLMAVDKMLFSRFAVQLDGGRLRGEAWGERLDRTRHQAAVEIKGATYTMLSVTHQNGLWMAQTVVDV